MSIEGYPDCRHLTHCEALASHLDEVTLIDLRPAEDFALGHIEGARSLDIYGISLNDSAAEPLEAFLCIFHTLFGARGVSRERPVVIYDHESGERAARAVWMLAVLDHPNVKLLDGGSQAWKASGRPLVQIGAVSAPVAPEKAPPTPPPFAGGRRLEYLASRFDVDRAIDDDSVVIVDVRRQSEHDGTEKRARRVGTIPGAVHVFWRDHLDENGALRPAETVRALYESKGVTPDKTVIALCQGGYRSASTFLALTALGYPQVRNYIGSWAEWGSRDDSRITLPT
ncbi:MAG: thiosulfate/3-mercaptopyruvate sulfurtransferase [Gammaproteobacteria bacterium]|jgi:thiosulfate/3-mercaptopyruvate sulfurtransferase